MKKLFLSALVPCLILVSGCQYPWQTNEISPQPVLEESKTETGENTVEVSKSQIEIPVSANTGSEVLEEDNLEWEIFLDNKTSLSFQSPKEFGIANRSFINNKMTFSGVYGTFILIPKTSQNSIEEMFSSICEEENIKTPFPNGQSSDTLIFCQEHNNNVLKNGISRKIVRNGVGGIYSPGDYNYEFQRTYVLEFDENEYYAGAILHMVWGESCLNRFTQYQNKALGHTKGDYTEQMKKQLTRKQECTDVINNIAYQACLQEENNIKKLETFAKVVDTISFK